MKFSIYTEDEKVVYISISGLDFEALGAPLKPGDERLVEIGLEPEQAAKIAGSMIEAAMFCGYQPSQSEHDHRPLIDTQRIAMINRTSLIIKSLVEQKVPLQRISVEVVDSILTAML